MGQYSAGAGMIRQPPISYNYMPGALLIELPDLFFFAFFDFELVMSLIEEIFKISLYTGETNLCCKEKSRNREVHIRHVGRGGGQGGRGPPPPEKIELQKK